MGQPWAPHYFRAIHDTVPAATAYTYNIEYPNTPYVYTLVYISGFSNSTQPMKSELFKDTLMIMTQRVPGGWYKEFINGALIRGVYGEKLVFRFYNHRSADVDLWCAFVHYKELS
jgi:hypothetical protein